MEKKSETAETREWANITLSNQRKIVKLVTRDNISWK